MSTPGASTRRVDAEELAGRVAFSDTVVTSARCKFLPEEELAPLLRLFHQTNLGARHRFRAVGESSACQT
jgi:hypothetical protein